MGYENQFAYGYEPVFQHNHRLSPTEWVIVEEKVAKPHKHGLIAPATGYYTAAKVLPENNDANGKYTDRRMCGYYRALNAKT